MPILQQRYVIDQALFPGSHCLNMSFSPRFEMRKELFMTLTRSTDATLAKWTTANLPKPFMVSIPPYNGSTDLPADAMLTFGNGEVTETEVRADCSVIFFRRGVPSSEEDIARLLLVHIEKDMTALMRILKALCLRNFRCDCLEEMVTRLHTFYSTVDPLQMQPILKQRIFDMQNAYMGHICAHCACFRASHQCPCKEGVYYCGKACQSAHWKKHRLICTVARKK